MKNFKITTVFVLGLFALSFVPTKGYSAYYVAIEECYCGVPVTKCRLVGTDPCGVEEQIPCEEACGM
ncbi:hypothetical protein SAMN04487988_11553 [Algoriphagus hitonicola]|uniref:Uncharacterized protein n=1 Tax=Algoriphagus hitonicola TaxID=435880 RepID=A0A1I2X1W7_9BACT|nr:hypothetical protein SAMN04487988_11553 [Algoriphagus hitonicola]